MMKADISIVQSKKGTEIMAEGMNTGVLGNLFELFQNREAFDLYVCPKCGKVEFFVPLLIISMNS